MNERIQELLIEAHRQTKGGIYTGQISEWTEKFAELIVRECIAQCEKNKDHEWLGPGSKLSAYNIKEHFGVEE